MPLGFGTGNLRSFQGGISGRDAVRLLEAAFESGIDLVDTAPSYGQGGAEESIGRLPDSIRSRLTVCSKVGIAYGRKAGLLGAVKPLLQPAIRLFPPLRRLAGASRSQMRATGSMTLDLRPETIRASLDGSLRRLRRERLDILLFHDPDLAAFRDENVAALEAMRASGRIGAWGVSTRSPEVARAAVAVAPLGWIQMPADPPWLAEAADVFPAAAAAGKRVIANRVLSPLRSDAPPGGPSDVAGCFRLALRQPGVVRILVGTTKRKHLEDNVAAMRRIVEEEGRTR